MSSTSTANWFEDLTDAEVARLGKEINNQGFDHVFQVTRRGVVDGPAGVYAPEDVENDDEHDISYEDTRWTALRGCTGQDRYHGAVMHASEFIGGRLAEDVIEMSAEAEAEGKPLLWTMTVVRALPEEDEEGEGEEGEVAGWAILYREI